MSIEELKRQVYENWMDAAGLVMLEPRSVRGNAYPSSGNGIFFLSLFLMLLHKLNAVESRDREHYVSTINNCQRVFCGNPCLGLFNRYPMGGLTDANLDDEAHDDYQGIVCVSKLLNTVHASNVLEWGRDHSWCYNNVEPGTWNFRLVHRPESFSFYQIVQGETPLPWHWLWLHGNITSTLFLKRGTTSPKLVTLFRLEGMSEVSTYWKLVKASWMKLLKLKNKGGIPEVFDIYFKFPGHPLKELARLAYK